MKLFILIALAAGSVFGAEPWDGTHGDFTLTTTAVTPRNPVGLSSVQTIFTVKCSNPNITAVRLKVVYSNPANGFVGTIVQTFDLGPLHNSSVTMNLDPTLITIPPQITGLVNEMTISF